MTIRKPDSNSRRPVIYYGPTWQGRRKRCAICGKLTHDWERVNGGEWRCWDCGGAIRIAHEKALAEIQGTKK